MIDAAWCRAMVAEIDARLEHLAAGRLLLEQLRAKYLELESHAGAPDGVGNGGASVAGEGGESRPNLERQGERIAAGEPRLGSTTRSQRRGHRSTDRESAPAAEGSTRINCPVCDEEVSARGLGVHRAKSKRHAAALAAATQPPAQPLGADVDRRNIDEECPRGCGRQFRWEPTLLSHIGTCKGAAQAEPGGGALRDIAGRGRRERVTAVAA